MPRAVTSSPRYAIMWRSWNSPLLGCPAGPRSMVPYNRYMSHCIKAMLQIVLNLCCINCITAVLCYIIMLCTGIKFQFFFQFWTFHCGTCLRIFNFWVQNYVTECCTYVVLNCLVTCFCSTNLWNEIMASVKLAKKFLAHTNKSDLQHIAILKQCSAVVIFPNSSLFLENIIVEKQLINQVMMFTDISTNTACFHSQSHLFLSHSINSTFLYGAEWHHVLLANHGRFW